MAKNAPKEMDVIRQIATNAPYPDILRLCATSRAARRLCSDAPENALFWRELVGRDFRPPFYPAIPARESAGWYSTYRAAWQRLWSEGVYVSSDGMLAWEPDELGDFELQLEFDGPTGRNVRAPPLGPDNRAPFRPLLQTALVAAPFSDGTLSRRITAPPGEWLTMRDIVAALGSFLAETPPPAIRQAAIARIHRKMRSAPEVSPPVTIATALLQEQQNHAISGIYMLLVGGSPAFAPATVDVIPDE